MQPTRVVVVGGGQRFRSGILPVLKNRRARIVAVVDPDDAVCDHIADLMNHERPLLSTHLTADLLAAAPADVAIIASPSGLHFEHTRMCLAAGLATFTEKPLACSSAEAADLYTLGSGRLAVSEQRPYRGDLALLRTIMNDGTLGRVQKVTYQDTIIPRADFRLSWRNDATLSGGGVLSDLGYHTIHTILWLLECADSDFIMCTVRTFHSPEFNVEERAEALCQVRGIRVRVSLRFVASLPGENLIVEGSRAAAHVRRVRGGTASLVAVHRSGQRSSMTTVALDDRYDAHSFDAFMGGDVPMLALQRHVSTVRILEALYQRAGKDVRR